MNNREVLGDVGRHLVARIVSSYVKHNTLALKELRDVDCLRASVVEQPRQGFCANPSPHAGRADPAIGSPRVCGPPRMRVSRPDAPASSEGRSRSRSCGVLRPLEAAG